MQISSRFTLAVQILCCIDMFGDSRNITSDFLAGSSNINPVTIRNILTQLKAAGLIQVGRGRNGTISICDPDKMTFFDIYSAVECIDHGELFHFHENPNQNCIVGKHIHQILDDKLQRIQSAMEKEMKSISWKDIKKDVDQLIP